MGISTTGSNIIWKATNVSTRELRMMILRSLSKDNRNVEIPRLDVDVSNVAHIMSVKCSTYESLVNDVASYLKDLAYETGFCVTAVLDGDTRPHFKRDSFKRRFDHAMKITNSLT